MTILYKLIDQDGYTRRGASGETLRYAGAVVTANQSVTPKLCVIHAYRYPELGLMLNPIHADLHEPRVWMVEGDVVADDGTKIGCRRVRCLHELEVDHSVLTASARVRTAIYLAALVCNDPSWQWWATRWLSGEDRPTWAARAATAAWAVWAAEAASWAAAAAWAAGAAWTAAVRAARAAEVATAAAWATWAAARAGLPPELAQSLILQAIGEEGI